MPLSESQVIEYLLNVPIEKAAAILRKSAKHHPTVEHECLQVLSEMLRQKSIRVLHELTNVNEAIEAMKTANQKFIILPNFEEAQIRACGSLVSVYGLMRALKIVRPANILHDVKQRFPLAEGLLQKTLFLGNVEQSIVVDLKDWFLLGHYIKEVAPKVSTEDLNLLNYDLGITLVNDTTMALPPVMEEDDQSATTNDSVTVREKPGIEIANGKMIFDELDGAAIRSDGELFSVFDFIKIVGGQKSPRKVWERLSAKHTEVVTFCHHFQFPGPGQRKTPATNREGLVQIAQVLPGEFGAKFRSEAAKIILAYLDADLKLADEVVDRAVAKGKTKEVEQHAARTQGIILRKQLTSVLSQHGVNQDGFRMVTNAVYIGLLGKPAPALRKDWGLKRGENVRPYMTPAQWTSLATVELALVRQLKEQKAWGNEECACIAHATALQISQLTGLAA